MIPRFKPKIGWPEWKELIGPSRADAVESFEAAFAAIMGQRHAIAFLYGRTCLMLLLEALGIRGREIICPAYTCVVVPHAIVHSGNEPVFIDSRENNFNMDLDLAEAAITEKTAALIATSIFGYPIDLDCLDRIRRNHPQVTIIQDCAHSFAAEWQGRPVQKEGRAAIFGLNISKLVTSIFGGMITTDDDALAGRLRDLRLRRLNPETFLHSVRQRAYLMVSTLAFWGPLYGIVNRLEQGGWLDHFSKYYDDGRIDMPADHLDWMTGVGAQVGQAQCKRYASIVNQHRMAADCYADCLQGLRDLEMPPLVAGATYSHFVIRVKDANARGSLLGRALARGVQLGQLIEYSVPEMPVYRKRCGARFACPVSAFLAQTAVNLPVWGGERVARKVSAVVREELTA
jgi:dTDP-4-amino-4,6-dideoxygalactose transaminase